MIRSLSEIQNSLSESVKSAREFNELIEIRKEIHTDIMWRKFNKYSKNDSINKFCDTLEELVELNEYFESNKFPIPKNILTRQEVKENVLKYKPKSYVSIKLFYGLSLIRKGLKELISTI